MKQWMVYLFALFLVGCASNGVSDERAHNSAKIHTELAASYFERGQYSVALQELGAAMQADDEYAPSYNVRGLVRMKLHEDAEADKDFRRALKLDPQSASAHNNYGWFLCQRGRPKDSISHFLDALKDPLYNTPDMAYANAGVCAIKADDLVAAESYLERALILHPGMPEAQVGLAELNYAKGDYAMAKVHLMRFMQVYDALAPEQLWLAVRIERKVGNRNAAESYALQLRKRFPESREAQLLQAGE
ncbi:MAG: type IV pilus biogenesis/stability protein PilW [Gammaproteobacteria bacterium]|nr:type IV pilus biogenesis/stability protein PilW [Gammaproteobacteria bacterium]MDD2928236.1 type IV pilus biogenesis/stability protein PilW [Sideroxydans sp.]MDD5470560.1 type IV pilus biogenesis/stability protein PilW [Sideroxydans sp.]